ncbi:aquaporin-like protein [Aureobasidium namibiae CBS 147.97]|uniref:Aquaporin-like protein n=1 Tax=Aureobasidium namibiae CBS 147.97 TaxID=1043004 RepID=A0A074XA14_9PEZI
MHLSLRENASQVKNHLTAVLGEILGTAMFLFIAEGAAKTANLARTASQSNTNAPLDSQTIMMIATSFGLALLVMAWMFYRITGGLFNPAITVALWLTGVLTTVRAIMLFGAQLIGGIIASALVLGLTPAGSGGVDVVNTTVSDQISYQQAFVLEFLGTSFLVFSVLMLAVEKHRATYLAPVGIGLTLFTLHLFLVAWTGCSLNPARSLGPAAVAGKFPQYHWIYWIAPLCGGVLSVMYFQLLKALNYNSTVLDQDSDHEVGGLRPVHMRVYKFMAGHHDWEKEESHHHKHKKFLTVLRHRKVMRHDGSFYYVQEPTVINSDQRHPHDDVLEDDDMTVVGSRSSGHQMRQQANTQSV